MSTTADALPASEIPLPREEEFLGHPKGVYVCFFTEMWERFSFYGMKALLLLYLIQHHKFGDRVGLDVLGAYGGLVYCLPVFGGLLADRWLGMRKAVVFGGILLVLGHLGMSVEGQAAHQVNGVMVRDESALQVFYLSLALIIMGVGFLKPNISTIVGKLYAQDDPRRDSGFSLFYAGINLGALFASIVCGYLGQTISWSWGFGAAGIGMLLGLAQFLWGQKYLHGHAEPPDPARLAASSPLGLSREKLIYLGAIAGLLPIAWLMQSVATIKVDHRVVYALVVVVVFALVGIAWSGWFAATKRDDNRGMFDRPSLAVALVLGAGACWLAHRYGVITYFQENSTLALVLMSLVFAVFSIWYVFYIVRVCSGVEGQKMTALMALIFMCLVFFVLYEQTYGSWITFTDRLLTKDVAPSLLIENTTVVWTKDWATNFGLFMHTVPWSIVSLLLAPGSFVLAATLSDRNPGSKAPKLLFAGSFALMTIFLIRDSVVLPQTGSSLGYLGGLFLVILAPVFTVLWGWLDKVGKDPSKPVKSALGLVIGGLSFVPLAMAAQHAGVTGEFASVWWLVLAYFVLEVGEMCLSPVGLSAVTQLSMPRVMSLMMGTWFLATAFSETLAALMGKLAALDDSELSDAGTLAQHSAQWVSAAAKYEHLFWIMMWIGLGFGLAAFIAAPFLKRAMHGVK